MLREVRARPKRSAISAGCKPLVVRWQAVRTRAEVDAHGGRTRATHANRAKGNPSEPPLTCRENCRVCGRFRNARPWATYFWGERLRGGGGFKMEGRHRPPTSQTRFFAPDILARIRARDRTGIFSSANIPGQSAASICPMRRASARAFLPSMRPSTERQQTASSLWTLGRSQGMLGPVLN